MACAAGLSPGTRTGLRQPRSLRAYLQTALHIDLDPDAGPHKAGILELRFDARRIEPAESVASVHEPQVLVDACRPSRESDDYFWPTRPGRYMLWHVQHPAHVFVRTDAGDWVYVDNAHGGFQPRSSESALRMAGWLGARVGAQPAPTLIRCGRAVGKSTALMDTRYAEYPTQSDPGVAPAAFGGVTIEPLPENDQILPPDLYVSTAIVTPPAGSSTGKTAPHPWPAVAPTTAELRAEWVRVFGDPATPAAQVAIDATVAKLEAVVTPNSEKVRREAAAYADKAEAAFRAATKGGRHEAWAFDHGLELCRLCRLLAAVTDAPQETKSEPERTERDAASEQSG